MKVKFYFSNGYCGCDMTEVEDFPNVTNIDDPEIVDYGDEEYYQYMDSWEDRFVDYPDREDFDSEEDYYAACAEMYEEYIDSGEWWCEEEV